jgi:hypothetical protein
MNEGRDIGSSRFGEQTGSRSAVKVGQEGESILSSIDDLGAIRRFFQ